MTKISMKIVVELDEELWDADYGTGTDAASVKEDVRQYTLTALQTVFEQTDMNAKVKVTA